MHTQDKLVAITYFEALRKWIQESEFAKFIGQTTARALQDGALSPEDNEKGSNGAAMRTAPIGWFCAGDPKRVVDLGKNK